MNNREQIILDQMRQMISLSCRSRNQQQNPLYNFQKAILKRFFDAAGVTIDFDNKNISLFTKASPTGGAVKLYRAKDVMAINISYTNLEETLKGCLETGIDNERHYSSLLFYYKNMMNENLVVQSA